MSRHGQVIEKNHFPEKWNRSMSLAMSDIDRRRSKVMLIALAAILALATLAPMAVLAG
jgi:hypothetical protein